LNSHRSSPGFSGVERNSCCCQQPHQVPYKNSRAFTSFRYATELPRLFRRGAARGSEYRRKQLLNRRVGLLASPCTFQHQRRASVRQLRCEPLERLGARPCVKRVASSRLACVLKDQAMIRAGLVTRFARSLSSMSPRPSHTWATAECRTQGPSAERQVACRGSCSAALSRQRRCALLKA